MKVKDVMAVAVKTCREDSSLHAAAKIMWEQDIGCVPIVDHENHVVGILTDRDICMAAYVHAAPLTALSVTNAMTRQVLFCRPDDELASVERLMRERRIHRMPVVNPQGRLLGIISLNDCERSHLR